MKKQLSAALPDDLRKNLRLAANRAEVQVQRARFAGIKTPAGGWPVLMGCYFPRSGSQFLDQALLGFARLAPFSPHLVLPFSSYDEAHRKRSLQAALHYIHALRPLDVTSALLLAWPEVVEAVCTPKFIPYIIFRDPRDVAVSHVFHITELVPGQAVDQTLKNFDERLKISILGHPAAAEEFPDIARRFELYRGWLDRPQVLVVRFEDFINERRATLGRMVDHFLRRVDTLPAGREQMIDTLEASFDPQSSTALRPGRTGEWKKYFKDEHKQLFKDVTGDLLVQLGYEKDNNW